MGSRNDTPEHRFGEKIAYDPDTGCIEWLAYRDRKGYGEFTLLDVTTKAHRAALVLSGQTLNPALVVDHLCRNEGCVNPEHLEQVTSRVNNIVRGTGGTAAQQARQTHCKNGHPFTSENTYLYPGRRHRECRICKREWERKRVRTY